ncbi:haloacid dehalogenase-like hydrolase [Streptomyces sp. NPDC056690]|uniref:haloacid dehalogenase-like hydrolase n=1 Tax=unclassified Streptomyces TaxID=2593676 RepID=UPI00363D8EC0
MGADVLVCSRPQIGSDQHYTGNLETPMIGEAKSAAATALAAEHAVSLAHSTAYGDHISDLPLLNVAGCDRPLPRCAICCTGRAATQGRCGPGAESRGSHLQDVWSAHGEGQSTVPTASPSTKPTPPMAPPVRLPERRIELGREGYG